jgi:lipopolysaccharide export system protein LptA
MSRFASRAGLWHGGLLAALMALPVIVGAQQPRAPQGPVSISADRGELSRSGVMVYIGNVEFEADGTVVRGDRMTFQQRADGLYDAHITGSPASFSHPAQDGEPAVNAQAQDVRYTAADRVVTLDGDVELDRGRDRLTGQNLRYEVDDRRILASGGEGGRVRITIQPPERGSGGSGQ